MKQHTISSSRITRCPEWDGIGFLKIVRARFPDLPFIIFTGRGREEVVIEALNCGADHYIQKGGDPRAQFTELIHTIRNSVEKRRALETIFHLNRLYSVISRTNRAIIHLLDRQHFEEACKIAVEEGKFLMAWVGITKSGDPRKVLPDRGIRVQSGYLSMLSITVDNVPQGMGLTGSSIREGRPMVCNDIQSDPRMEKYREGASRRGDCSYPSVPAQEWEHSRRSNAILLERE